MRSRLAWCGVLVAMAWTTVLPIAASMEQDWGETVYLGGVVRAEDGSLPGDVGIAIHVEYVCDQARCARVEQSWHTNVRTDENGAWSAKVPAGGTTVFASDVREASAWSGERFQQTRHSLTTRPGESHDVGVTVVFMPPSSVTIRGRVVDREDGAPLEGASIWAWNSHWGVYESAPDTDGEGLFEIAFPPGRIFLETTVESVADETCPGATPERDADDSPVASIPLCRERRLAHDYHSSRTLVEAQANETLEVEIGLARAPPAREGEGREAWVTGWVVAGPTSEAVAGAYVAAFNEASFEWGYVVTDEHGAYRLRAGPGHLALQMRADGMREELAQLDVVEGGAVQWNVITAPGKGPQCCYGWVESYDIPSEGAAPPPPPRPFLPPEADEDLSLNLRNRFDFEAWDDYPGWRQAYEGVEADLGPYDPARNLSYTPPDRPVQQNAVSGLGSAEGVALAALVFVASGRRHRPG